MLSGSEISGRGKLVTITRPATTPTYTAGDVIGDVGGSAIFTFPDIGKVGGEIIITSVELEIDIASVTSGMTGFNLRLYNASPTAIADDAAWNLVSGDRGKYLGKIQLVTPIDEGSTLFCDNDGINKQITLASTNLYVELQTIGSYVATTSAVYRVTIHATQV